MQLRVNAQVLSLACVCLVALSAPSAHAQCDLTGYTSHLLVNSPAVAIPDDSPAGLEAGTIVTPTTGFFLDVIAELEVNHTYLGDLVATLSYDVTCDGVAEASVDLICRQGEPTACATEATVTFGCAADLDCQEQYLFSDDGATDLSDNGTVTACVFAEPPLPGGCYLPSQAPNLGTMSVFDGLPTGGCFKLFIADFASPDPGSICQWGVHYTVDTPIATEDDSWGSVKRIYR